MFGYRGAHSALVLAVGNENRPARQFYQKELSKKNHEQMWQHTVVAVVAVVGTLGCHSGQFKYFLLLGNLVSLSRKFCEEQPLF